MDTPSPSISKQYSTTWLAVCSTGAAADGAALAPPRTNHSPLISVANHRSATRGPWVGDRDGRIALWLWSQSARVLTRRDMARATTVCVCMRACLEGIDRNRSRFGTARPVLDRWAT